MADAPRKAAPIVLSKVAWFVIPSPQLKGCVLTKEIAAKPSDNSYIPKGARLSLGTCPIVGFCFFLDCSIGHPKGVRPLTQRSTKKL